MRSMFFMIVFLSITLFIEAEEQFPFLGISVSTQNIGFSEIDKTRDTGISIRYGKQSQQWRTTFGADFNTDSYSGVFVKIDKILLDSMFGTPKFRPYLGATVGYMYFNELDNIPVPADQNRNDLEQNGFYFGGNFGFIIYATDTVDIDIGYHYYKIQNLDYLDDIHGAEIALHYFF